MFFVNKHIAHYVFTHSTRSHKKLIFILFFAEKKQDIKYCGTKMKGRERQWKKTKVMEVYGERCLCFSCQQNYKHMKKESLILSRLVKKTFPRNNNNNKIRKDFNGVWQHIHPQTFFMITIFPLSASMKGFLFYHLYKN